jgi:hypothetical protein
MNKPRRRKNQFLILIPGSCSEVEGFGGWAARVEEGPTLAVGGWGRGGGGGGGGGGGSITEIGVLYFMEDNSINSG